MCLSEILEHLHCIVSGDNATLGGPMVCSSIRWLHMFMYILHMHPCVHTQIRDIEELRNLLASVLVGIILYTLCNSSVQYVPFHKLASFLHISLHSYMMTSNWSHHL